MPIHAAGIFGCGTMGAGMAQVVLAAGYVVIVREDLKRRLHL